MQQVATTQSSFTMAYFLTLSDVISAHIISKWFHQSDSLL